MKASTIIKNSRGKVISFFGFYPSKSFVEVEKVYIDFNDDGTEIKLHINGKIVATIEWFEKFYGTKASENEIWAYIMQKCHKYTQASKIFIDKFYIDCYFPLAELIRPKTQTEIEASRKEAELNYFFEQNQK